jgi:hypothetical protein
LEPGIYTNFFQVEIQNLSSAGVVFADTRDVGLAHDVRPKVAAHVHQLGPTVYGFGQHAGQLTSGFSPVPQDTLVDEPGLVSRMVVDSFLDRLEELGYTTERSRVRQWAYHSGRAVTTSIREAKVIPGYLIRSSFFNDPVHDELVFGLVIDPWFRFELNGKPTNFGQLRQFAASRGGGSAAAAIVPEVMMKIGMLTPYRKRNRESFKSKVDRTLALVKEVKEFSLGGGCTAQISLQPARVIMQE